MQIRENADTRIVNRLLLLTDHENTTEALNMLQGEGYSVSHDYCQRYDVEKLDRLSPDAILIDLQNPSVQNVSICRDLRQYYHGPILVLAARGSEVVQVLGLEMGADDFLFKPQPEPLLMAKLRSVLRRSEETHRRQKKMIRLGELVIDAGRREVHCSGEVVSLTPREFDLLWCLAENAKNIISRDEIHQFLYNCEYNGYDRSIDIYISRIRQKIGDDPVKPRFLKTVRGAGYLLVEGHAGSSHG